MNPAVDAQQPSPDPSPADPAAPGDPGDASQPPVHGTPPAGATPDGPGGGSPTAGVPAERPVLASSRVAAKASSVSIVGAQFSAFAFKPKTITVHVGDTVRWVNNSSAPEGHTVTGHGLDSGTLHQGDDYSFKFSKAGTYDYVCAFHSNMKGEREGSRLWRQQRRGIVERRLVERWGIVRAPDRAREAAARPARASAPAPRIRAALASFRITGLPLLPLAVAGVGLILLGALLSRLEFY